MDPYSGSSSSSSSYVLIDPPQEAKRLPSLHSVRKPPVKPWKKPVAPPPPRVYRVDPINFRKVVQELTGAPEIRSRRLQSVAPPPLDLAMQPPSVSDLSSPLQLFCSTERPSSCSYQSLASEAVETMTGKLSHEGYLASTSLGLGSSPSSYSWCSFPLLSPGTLASLEQSTLLF